MTDSETSLDAENLYRMHVQQVGRWVARLGGPALDLEDTVHEVFATVYARLSTFRVDANLVAWLFGITDKVVRHRRRKMRWWRWLSGTADETAGHLPAKDTDPARTAEQNQTVKSVHRVLDRLAEGDRRILILFELEELTADEVGDLLGIKPANARLRLHRARARFQKIYERDLRSDPSGVANTKATSERCEHVNR